MVARLGTKSVLVVVQPRHPGFGPQQLRERLEKLYRPLFPAGLAWARRDAAGTTLLGGFDLESRDVPDEPLTVWGIPVGAAGDASDAELEAVGRDVALARDLLGTWVVVIEHERGLRLISSSDLVHTLVRAAGPEGVAFATKGLAALVAVGAPVTIARERVPELVLLDYVLGDDELLLGTTVLDEAGVVELGSEGERIRSYWSLEERFSPGPPTTPECLREVLGSELRRLAASEGAHVALTAGRDSTLVASCLVEQGVAVPTFTMGDASFPDVVGAAAVAKAWGVSHRCMPPSAGRAQFDRALERSLWTEGMDTAWNLVGSGLDWNGPSSIVWLGGSGGEIGRAFYWSDHAGDRPSVRALVDSMLPGTARMTGTAGRALRRRCEETVVLAADTTGRTGWSALDVVYARGRMRKWLLRTMPRQQARGFLSGYTSPKVVRALLDLPFDLRVSGLAFDQALDLAQPNLFKVAQSALPARAHVGPRAAWRRAVSRAVPQPLLDRRRRMPAQAVTGPLADVLAEVGDLEIAREALGSTWCDTAVRRRGGEPGMQHQLWNAIAVEALSARLAALRAAGTPFEP